jgi:putative ATP-dependent endonuclease of the OLD family
MHLSKLSIKNYRSIKEVDLKFKKGKNIIVGKNNSGKSNILRAINLIFGESSPTYHKSENITENDFNSGNTKEPIYIFCELTRDSNEALNYHEIYKCLGFKYHVAEKTWDKGQSRWTGTAVRHQLRRDGNFWDDLDALMNIDEDEVTNIYVNPKLRNQQNFEEQFHNKYCFAFGFRADYRANNKIHKEIRFFYRENDKAPWIMSFSAPVRCELLQSAIIPSFRDPANELRINQWTWFGKLLKNYVNTEDPTLMEAFDQLRTASDGVFQHLKTHINNNKVKVAFPDTTISFQFNPDTRVDVYKSALIYVDDGFNSLLQDKGSGIQSAVIIGLFHYYTRNIAHASSSLLVVEEPELYLHPQARRVISQRLEDFLEENKNQVILTTHAPEFITSAHDDLNIIVVRKSQKDGSLATNTMIADSKERQILIKVQNSEMFFADKVVLVEGGDKYILEAIAKYYGNEVNKELGSNWINDKNYSIIAVGGKTEFWKYYKKLKELKIKPFILADFDFFLRSFNEFLTHLNAKPETINELNAIKGQIGIVDFQIKKKILEGIENFQKILQQEGCTIDERSLKIKLKEPFKTKSLHQIDYKYHDAILNFLEKFKAVGIYILQNELEDYYTDKCKGLLKGINGKEEKPIHIVSQLITSEQPVTEFIKCHEYIDFLDRIMTLN